MSKAKGVSFSVSLTENAAALLLRRLLLLLLLLPLEDEKEAP
jgi:hypothetical protein